MLVCWVAVCRWWQHLKLVRHHVVQALIVDVAHKDVRLQLLSIDTTVHSVVAKVNCTHLCSKTKVVCCAFPTPNPAKVTTSG